MAIIENVTANDDYTLLVELANNHRIVCDMRAKLQTTRFRGLADPARFKAVRVEHGNTLVWSSLCQLTIDEILAMIDR